LRLRHDSVRAGTARRVVGEVDVAHAVGSWATSARGGLIHTAAGSSVGRGAPRTKRRAVNAAIKQSALPVPVKMWHGDGTVEIEVGAQPVPHDYPATIRLALLTSEATVDIQRGENAGQTLEYYNGVRAMRPIGMWDGEAVKITLPGKELMAHDIDGCAIIVQEDTPKGPGAILGAAWLGDW